MNFVETLQMAGKTLVANKLRTALTMLGIIIGNSSVIVMVGLGEGGQRYVAQQLNSLGPNVLFVIPGNEETQRVSRDVIKTLVYADAEAIETQVPTIKATAAELNSRQVVTYKNRNTNVNIIGTTPNFLKVRNFEVATGRFFNDLDMKRSNQVAVIGSKLKQKMFGNQNPISQQIKIKNSSFQIIGVLTEKGSNLGVDYDSSALVPIMTSANRIVGKTSPYGLEVTYITASAQDADSVDAAKFQITNLLRRRHKLVGENDFTIRTQKDALQIVGQISNALSLMLVGIAGISLFVGGIGIMNIMLVSVTERTQEIGLRKAIGATQQDILLQFIVEAIIVSVIGGLAGTGIGIGGLGLISSLGIIDASTSLSSIFMTVGISGAIGLFFGVFPARRAAQLDPIVALRSA
ncbi:ABC transporter permease [Cylindrospermopsis raciborskii]|uniref:ABC transporter permease n=1 Tax=Cylindrospermopsis raciborskii CENA302 TaxID=1170768 RepID=A0A9Q5QVA2_9CYAN|nr:ABC transporter permease [Cylindrospermopsis raciborskii]MCZ2201980.1 ABC transporter permease [Cylindrospermopsis raciborskii PAMP2012]MCZ2205241.1 ABC transporter permease [Cylindrospermopsis raciborskii PAMP2011]NLQ04866.1 FtsX-like permease family protein [Cylindrospermopsis raciborskii MVCC19]OHY33857.1 ABC transporter permease [Cylindrospermopsis raciborskii MVCC14]OPH08880.1 ABC transporter permease [Cylindrospermopsis raciborskii CENA302]